MKKSLATLSLLAFCAASFASTPAMAAIVYVTVTGTVASGTDVGGVFGTSGANVAGDAYTAQYEFNTNLGGTFVSATETDVSGGLERSPVTTSPSLGASLTINGHTSSIAGAYDGEIVGYNDGSFSQTAASANDSISSYLNSDIYGSAINIPASITTPFSVINNGDTVQSNFSGEGTFLQLGINVYTLSLTDPTSVPEPASVALLGVGLLGTGVMARRRRLTHSGEPSQSL